MVVESCSVIRNAKNARVPTVLSESLAQAILGGTLTLNFKTFSIRWCYTRRFATTIFRATMMEQCCNKNSKQCPNNAANALLRSKSSLRIVPCYIALKLSNAVYGFSILKITCSSFDSPICIIFCCRVPPHGESLHGFLTGARYNRYLNAYTQVNTTSNGPFRIEDSSFGPKDASLHRVPISMSQCPLSLSLKHFFFLFKHILLTKFALRVTKNSSRGLTSDIILA